MGRVALGVASILKKDSLATFVATYKIRAKRQTTIRHAFASAIAATDPYSDALVRSALQVLGQDPDGELACVYCDRPAQTWDHLNGLVRGGKYSGHGHTVGNLVPACKECNSQKGNKDWKQFVHQKGYGLAATRLEAYTAQFSGISPTYDELSALDPEVGRRCEQIQDEILRLMDKGDELADQLRAAARKAK